MTSPTPVPPPDQGASQPGAAPAAGGSPGQPAPWQPGWHDHHRDDRRGAIVGGVFLVFLGVVFLLQELVPDLDIGRFWPLILVVIGALLIASSVRRGA
ncbi:MAG: LiaI-LiaF-like domain-containing protein [Candidatus Limnocylindrales bacterium]